MNRNLALSLLLTLTVSASSLADAFDPGNDTPPGARLAAPKVTTTTINGLTLSAIADRFDYYQLFLVQGRRYNIGFGTDYPINDPPHPHLTVMNGNTIVLDDSHVSQFGFSFTAASTGAYTILVEPFFFTPGTAVAQTINYRLLYTDLTGGTPGGGGGGTIPIVGTPVLDDTLPIVTIDNTSASGGTIDVIGTASTGSGAAPSVEIAQIQYRTRFRTDPWTGWKTADGKEDFRFSVSAPSSGTYIIQAKAFDTEGREGLPRTSAARP